MIQTMEQKRAAHAWECANRARSEIQSAEKKEKNKDKYKDYVNAAKGLPALIMNSGLMQVMAYLNGKKELRYGLLSGQLREWLHKSLHTPTDFESFMEHLLKAEPREFQAITSEAFAWLKWLRQMAPALEKGE